MANVTYLLGAGASCEALPIYKNFLGRFKAFASLFSYERNGKASLIPDKNYSNNIDFNLISSHCKRIIEEISAHRTPDTVAKKYFHSRGEDYHLLIDLKRVLILFFLFEQIVEPKAKTLLYEAFAPEKKVEFQNAEDDSNEIKSLDKRYDAFIASLLKPIPNSLKLKENFKVLTWNYDLQFEKAYSNYLGFLDSEVIQNNIQSVPKILNPALKSFNPDLFSIVHLNGIACERRKGVSKWSIPFSKPYPISSELMDEILDCYKRLVTDGDSMYSADCDLLTFAWENLNPDSSIKKSTTLDIAEKIANETDILVVIGYSFPVFNREIDEFLLKKMNLKKIYIQDNNANTVRQILVNLLKSKLPENLIEVIDYVNQFYIPPEQSVNYKNIGPGIVLR